MAESEDLFQQSSAIYYEDSEQLAEEQYKNFENSLNMNAKIKPVVSTQISYARPSPYTVTKKLPKVEQISNPQLGSIIDRDHPYGALSSLQSTPTNRSQFEYKPQKENILPKFNSTYTKQ